MAHSGAGVSMAMEESRNQLLPLKCAVCQKPDSRRCSNCLKVSYCGKVHQTENWKLHKSVCFPVELRWHATQGRYLLATRLIAPGEVFMKEKPLLSGPSGLQIDSSDPVCLSCYRIVESGYKCAKCRWSVCDVNCQKNPVHANFECSVFSSAGLGPAQAHVRNLDGAESAVAHNILVLRGLLLKKRDPAKWEQLRQLEAHVKDLKEYRIQNLATALAVDFVHNKCGLKDQFDVEDIEFVNGAIRINLLGNEDRFSDPSAVSSRREALHLYRNGSMVTHACTPNAFSFIGADCDYNLNLKAVVPIQPGESIGMSYCPILYGTDRRRVQLQHNYCFGCTCSRCADPTEHGTHFSSIRCVECRDSSKNETNEGEGVDSGYLLPIDPLNHWSEWQCNNTGNSGRHCGSRKSARGSNEIASCIYDFVAKTYNRRRNNRQLTIWFDRCSGQNNVIILTMMMRLVRQGYFRSFRQKFFVTGHSYNTADRNFAHVEKLARNRPVQTPEEIELLIRDAVTENPFTVVRFPQASVRNFKNASKSVKFPGEFRVTKHLWYSYFAGQPRLLFSKTGHNLYEPERAHQLVLNPLNFQNTVVPQDHGPLMMDNAKLQDMRKSLEYLSGEHLQFYTQVIEEQAALRNEDSEEDADPRDP